ncbi:hypothetical protein PanWU01x14_264700 [Parasponia andersonii]|uniref:Uncharacterized protein n=1 Tax=Parasponia andersonii TaxID=3476 RepID=A0A2P5B7A4_PARAD|nr:hypothetical protein PanWU01x14_264700 [Parasponia andersonii]
MGNAASCAPSIISNGATKVLSSDGTMEIYTRPIKAAEIMLENPGMFVCDWSSLQVGHRIHGLSADEELEKRQLYLLLPMELLYSVLTHEEMSSFTSFGTNPKALVNNSSYNSSSSTSNNGSNNFVNFGKIFPSLGEFCMFLPSETKTLGSPINCQPEPVERYSKQRSWRPALETIVETPSRH